MKNLNGGRWEETKTGEKVNPDAAKIAGQASLRKAVEDHEEAMRMRDLLGRSIATLSALAKNENPIVHERLADFKNSVQKATAVEEIEKSLSALRNALAKSEHIAVGTVADAGVALAGPVNRDPAIGSNGHGKALQSIFLGLISEFDHDFGEDYSGHVVKIRKKVEQSSQLAEIAAVGNEIIGLVQAYNQVINDERNMVTDFISEIGAGLLEVERQYLDSMNQTGQSRSEDTKFNNMLENHVEEMKKSAQLSTTLAEFRGIVMSRLASIRAALAEKRQAEALRQESLRMEMESLNLNLNRMKKEVDQVHEKRKALEKEVHIDPLTGVANRRALKERLKGELYRFQRYRQFFSMLLFDVDHFKAINDRFGHWAGDKCLKEIIKRIRPILREADCIGRWGGDEFLVIFPGTDQESAAAVAERIRRLIQNTRFVYHKQEISFTVSIGVAEVHDSDQSQETVFNRVDKAMYAAKKAGRNMVTAIK